VNRLFRTAALVLSLVAVLAFGAAACSYVSPPVMTISTRGADEPFFTFTNDDLDAALEEAKTGAMTPSTQPYERTETIVGILNEKVITQVWAQLLKDVNATVTDADRDYAQQLAQQQRADASMVESYTNAEAYGRALAEEEYAAGRADPERLAREYYEQNPAAFTTPAQLCLHVMGFQAGDPTLGEPTEEDYATALDQANQARARAATEPFEQVAAEVSDIKDDVPDADLGCRSEQFLSQELPAEAVARLTTLPAGTIDEPLRVSGGYYLFRVDDYRPEVTPAYDEVTLKARDAATRNLGSQLRSERLREDVQRFEITVDPRYGRWDADQVQVVPPSGALTPTTPTTAPTLLDGGEGPEAGPGQPADETPGTPPGTPPPGDVPPATAAPDPTTTEQP
jgi:hypothetical protein